MRVKENAHNKVDNMFALMEEDQCGHDPGKKDEVITMV